MDTLPVINPLAEEKLIRCLKKEVEVYTANVKGTKCMLCSFRAFSKLASLKVHLKYHCSKNMYLADVRSKQRLVLRAYYDYCEMSKRMLRLSCYKNRAFSFI